MTDGDLPGGTSGREGKWAASGRSLGTEMAEYPGRAKRHTRWLWSRAELGLRTASATASPVTGSMPLNLLEPLTPQLSDALGVSGTEQTVPSLRRTCFYRVTCSRPAAGSGRQPEPAFAERRTSRPLAEKPLFLVILPFSHSSAWKLCSRNLNFQTLGRAGSAPTRASEGLRGRMTSSRRGSLQVWEAGAWGAEIALMRTLRILPLPTPSSPVLPPFFFPFSLFPPLCAWLFSSLPFSLPVAASGDTCPQDGGLGNKEATSVSSPPLFPHPSPHGRGQVS